VKTGVGMVNVTCFQSRDIPGFLEGSLSPEREAAFRDHLDDCPDCQAEADRHLGLMEAMVELMAQGEDEASVGDHLSEKFIVALARGEQDFTRIEVENQHILQCADCRARLREIEQRVVEDIRAVADVEYHYPVNEYYREQVRLAARGREGEGELSAEAHDSAQTLISCRRFRAEIYCRDNDVYAVIFTDDPETVGPLSVRVLDGESETAVRTDEGELRDDRRTYHLGEIRDLEGKGAEVSFEFEEEQWRRRIRFGEAAADD
jgi:hypothetical protein